MSKMQKKKYSDKLYDTIQALEAEGFKIALNINSDNEYRHANSFTEHNSFSVMTKDMVVSKECPARGEIIRIIVFILSNFTLGYIRDPRDCRDYYLSTDERSLYEFQRLCEEEEPHALGPYTGYLQWWIKDIITKYELIELNDPKAKMLL